MPRVEWGCILAATQARQVEWEVEWEVYSITNMCGNRAVDYVGGQRPEIHNTRMKVPRMGPRQAPHTAAAEKSRLPPTKKPLKCGNLFCFLEFPFDFKKEKLLSPQPAAGAAKISPFGGKTRSSSGPTESANSLRHPIIHRSMKAIPQQYPSSTPAVPQQYPCSIPAIPVQYPLSIPAIRPQYPCSGPAGLLQYPCSTSGVYPCSTPVVPQQYSKSTPAVAMQ